MLNLWICKLISTKNISNFTGKNNRKEGLRYENTFLSK